jgi:hypothetical protein
MVRDVDSKLPCCDRSISPVAGSTSPLRFIDHGDDCAVLCAPWRKCSPRRVLFYGRSMPFTDILFSACNETYTHVSRSSRQARLGLLRNAEIRFDIPTYLERGSHRNGRSTHGTVSFQPHSSDCPPTFTAVRDLTSIVREVGYNAW